MIDVNPTAPPGPALSATSDMPVIAKPEPEAKPATPAAEALPAATPAAATEPQPEPEKPTTEAAPAAAETKPAEAEPVKPDPAVTERALRGEITKEKNRRAAAEKKADEHAQRLDLALEALKKVTPAAAAAEPAADPRPQPATFETPAAYDAALEAWATRQGTEAGKLEARRQFETEQAAKEKDTAAAKAKSDQDAVVTQWQARAKKIEADVPDLVEVVSASDAPMSPVMQACLYRAENGPLIAYHLAKNPDEATRIYGLGTELEQVLAMGELAQQIKQSRKPTASKAPPPVKPIGVKNNAGPKDVNEMTGDEYYAHRMAQKKAAAAH